MKIGVIHISDIHISANNKDILTRLMEKMQKACFSELSEVIKLYIVVTGDIANTGSKEEYDIALFFFKTIWQNIKNNHHTINSIKFVFTPGNHDCDFTFDNPVRDALLSTIKTENIAVEIVNNCLSVQNNFWSFFQEITKENIDSKISYSIKDQLTIDSNIIFNCYNSSWMSVKKEKDNTIIMPTTAFLDNKAKKNDIIISIFHHPTSWFNPHTDNNNKNQFEEHLLKSSNMVLCGHEHSNKNRKYSSLTSNDEFIYLESEAFLYKNQSKVQSGFKFISFDSKDFSGNYVSFELSSEEYIAKESNTFMLSHNRTDINLTDAFFQQINEISIPIKHPSVENLKLSDIFIFPDFEAMGDRMDISSKRNKDSFDILSLDNNRIIIEGENQSGRTSLLYAYFYQFYKKDIYPIYVKGSSIKTVNFKDVIKNAVKNEYKKPFTHVDYLRLDKCKRVILIDDINKCELNTKGKSKLFDSLIQHFDKIIITTQESNEIHAIAENHKIYNDFVHYRIYPFGHYKRNALIERWVKLSVTNEYIIKEEEIADNIRKTYDTITSLLGEQLIPSYPIFILSLLQSLDSQLSFDTAPTSYAYCYHSLIVLCLMREGVSNNELGCLFNFLTEFSYFLYKRRENTISLVDFESFYREYTNLYPFNYSLDEMKTLLINSNLLKIEEEQVMFSYKYLSYYLSAKKISYFIHKNEGEIEVRHLCNNIHIESNANILIFLTHHTNNSNFIEELLCASILPFESRDPITLRVDDPFFTFLQSFVSAIKDDVILSNNNPDEYRKKQLKEADKKERSLARSKRMTDEDLKDPNIIDVTQTTKIIKILGQIVKNQHGSFEKKKLISLIKYAYLASFRLINFFSSVLIDAKDEIVEMLSDEIADLSSRDQIQKKVSDFLYLLGYRVCIAAFSNLSNAVGTSHLKSLYEEVANDLNTPASKLITFTIKTYYGNMNTRELERLMDDFKNNPVAQRIIKDRVLSHVYNNYVPYDKKQKIGEICKMKLMNS